MTTAHAAPTNDRRPRTDSAPAERARTAAAKAPSLAEVVASFRGAPHAKLDVGHSRLAYWKFGAGPDVVLVHGWPFHSATFRGLIPELAGSFTCHLIDLPGAGQTESDDDAPISLTGHAETVRRAADVLGLGRYALLAFDSGGAVARHVAAADPRVAGLALGNTEIPGATSPALVLFFAMLRLGGLPLLRLALGNRVLRRSPVSLGGCFSDLRCLEGEFHEFFVEPILRSEAVGRGQMKLGGRSTSRTSPG